MKLQDLEVKTKFSAGADIPCNEIQDHDVYLNYLKYIEWVQLHEAYEGEPLSEKEFVASYTKEKFPIYPFVENTFTIPGLDLSDYDVIIRSGAAIKGLSAYTTPTGFAVWNTNDESVAQSYEKALVQITVPFGDEEIVDVKEYSKEYACNFFNSVFKSNLDPTSYETVYEVINEYNGNNVIYDHNTYSKFIIIPANSTVKFPSGIIFNRAVPNFDEERCFYKDGKNVNNDYGLAVHYVGPLADRVLESHTLIDADYPNAYSVILHNMGGSDICIKLDKIKLKHEYKKNISLFKPEIKVCEDERTGGFSSTDAKKA